MTEVLLEELNDSDIDWLTASGRKQRIAANQVLIRQGDPIGAFYVVLEGGLVASVMEGERSTLGRAFSALSSDEQPSGQEVGRFALGDVVGEASLLGKANSVVAVTTLEDSELLVLPYEQMRLHLSQDIEFAARFYRAIAILLLKRFEKLLETFSRRKGLKIPPLQDGPLLFGELSDSDINWMVEQASVEEVEAEQVLIQAGRSVENLYIVLQGELSLSMVERKRSTMGNIFDRLEDNSEGGRQIAQVSRGEIVGETALLDSRLSNFRVETSKPSILLGLSRSRMALKLQQDPAMAARFYRILSILLASRLEGLINRLGYNRSSYRVGQALSQTVEYDDELDLESIDSLSLGGARFDWMLKRLNIRTV